MYYTSIILCISYAQKINRQANTIRTKQTVRQLSMIQIRLQSSPMFNPPNKTKSIGHKNMHINTDASTR